MNTEEKYKIMKNFHYLHELTYLTSNRWKGYEIFCTLFFSVFIGLLISSFVLFIMAFIVNLIILSFPVFITLSSIIVGLFYMISSMIKIKKEESGKLSTIENEFLIDFSQNHKKISQQAQDLFKSFNDKLGNDKDFLDTFLKDIEDGVFCVFGDIKKDEEIKNGSSQKLMT